MKTVEAEVKSARLKGGGFTEGRKQIVVGKVQYPQYDTLDEAVKAMSEPKVLGLCNSQVATNAKNEFRAEAVGSPSEKNLKAEAFARIATTPELLQRLQSAAGDTVAINAITDEVIAKIKAEKGIAEDVDDAA